MKNYIKALVVGVICLIMTACFVIRPGDSGKAEAASRGGYQINSYDCYYRVTEDNTYHVTETIDVTFLEYRHGIYRYIPEINYVSRADGSTDTVIASVDVISVSDEYEDSRESGSRMIKIGDPDEEIIGNHVYTISYDVKWGNDRVEGEDEFYMNLIGDGWDVPVNNLTFTIEMPKSFEDTGSNIGMYYGPKLSDKVEGIKYGFDGKVIRGSLVGYYIEPGSFFTVRIELEDGYFSKTSSVPVDGIIAVVLCCVFLMVSLLIWMFKGRDKDVIDIVEFYPPDGLNCAEMAYAYFGDVQGKDTVPMLISLASKGYIKIIQNDEKGNKFSFKILRDTYEGTDVAEMMFFNGLMKYGDIITKKELENSFYKTIDKVKSKVEETMKEKIFEPKTLMYRLITFPFALIPYLIGLFSSVRFYTGEFIFAWIMPLGLCVGISSLICMMSSKRSGVVTRTIVSIASVALLVLAYFLFRGSINYAGAFYWVVFVACIVANLGQMIFFRIIDKRTDYGIDLLGRIRGFRRYLETAERPHLVALVDQDPEYFYKILPYTYVLDITDEWVEQFESIAIDPPNWYSGYSGSTFSYYSFNRFMSSTMTSTQMAMTSSPSSSSGGGHSGGGGGGGGGGSW